MISVEASILEIQASTNIDASACERHYSYDTKHAETMLDGIRMMHLYHVIITTVGTPLKC